MMNVRVTLRVPPRPHSVAAEGDAYSNSGGFQGV
jgi:hypothetical protein